MHWLAIIAVILGYAAWRLDQARRQVGDQLTECGGQTESDGERLDVEA